MVEYRNYFWKKSSTVSLKILIKLGRKKEKPRSSQVTEKWLDQQELQDQAPLRLPNADAAHQQINYSRTMMQSCTCPINIKTLQEPL